MEVVKADAGKAEAMEAEVVMVEAAMDECPEHLAHRSPQKHASRRM